MLKGTPTQTVRKQPSGFEYEISNRRRRPKPSSANAMSYQRELDKIGYTKGSKSKGTVGQARLIRCRRKVSQRRSDLNRQGVECPGPGRAIGSQDSAGRALGAMTR